MKRKLILTKEEGQKVLDFLNGEGGSFCLFKTVTTKGDNISVLLFHGYEEQAVNFSISKKIEKFLGDSNVYFLSCHGNLFPDWVKARSIMARDGEISAAIYPKESFDLLVVSDE